MAKKELGHRLKALVNSVRERTRTPTENITPILARKEQLS